MPETHPFLSPTLFGRSTNNLLTTIRARTFENNPQLAYLSLTNNRLTHIEAGAFSNNVVGSLSVNGNLFTRVPALGIQSGAHSIVQLELSANLITEIRANDFAGMSRVRGLLMGRNPVLSVHPSAFEGLTRLSGPPDVLAPLPELVGLSFWGADNPNAAPVGTRNWTFASIDPEAWPRQCLWVGPMLNDFSCDECTNGYVDRNGVCEFPTFGVRPGFWDRTTLENDPQMGVPDASGDRVIFLRNDIALPPPATAANPKQGFVGYSDNDYLGVTYELAFPGDIQVRTATPAHSDCSSLWLRRDLYKLTYTSRSRHRLAAAGPTTW